MVGLGTLWGISLAKGFYSNYIVGESQTTIDKERNLNKGAKVGIGALEYFRKHCNKAVDGVPVLLCKEEVFDQFAF